MRRQRYSWLAAIGFILSVAGTGLQAQDPPPPDTHLDDLHLGRSILPGVTGPAAGIWFVDSGTNPNRLNEWLATPKTLIPNINGPSGAGRLYYNLGTDIIVFFDGAAYQEVLQSATMLGVSLTSGLEIWRTSSRWFASNPARSVSNNQFFYPYLGSWHHHFGVRAFRPGTYTFTFQIVNPVAHNGAPLDPSQLYTITFRNRPVMNGTVNLPGWVAVDNTPDRIGNQARVFIFAANSQPTREDQALRFTDVYLNPDGTFQIPEALRDITDGEYRIGVRPLTATGLATLIPGNVALSVVTPGTFVLPDNHIGDINRDGIIDDEDFNTVVQNQGRTPSSSGYTPGSDVDGSNLVDGVDYDRVRLNQGRISEFFP
jgi:hypothetical protein